MKKKEYDFLNYISFPSSLKMINDEAKRTWVVWRSPIIGVEPDTPLNMQFQHKIQNILAEFNAPSNMTIQIYREEKRENWFWLHQVVPRETLFGTYHWKQYEFTTPPIPSTVSRARLVFTGGAGTPALSGTTWIEDLKIIQDDIPIYENKFANWTPYIIGGTIVIGSILGVSHLFKRR